MERRDEALQASITTGEVQGDTSAPKANNRTRRARHYRNRRGASDPKDLIPSDLRLITWMDDDGNELFKRRTLSLTLGQVRSVCGQLGYMPLNIVSVGANNMKPGMQKAPLVIILYPLAMNKLTRQGRSHLIKNHDEEQEVKSEWDPFPTTCWLSCPLLHAQICRLEDAGWIQKLEERLNSSDEHVGSMEEAHKAYARFRWELLGKSDRELVERMGWSNMMKHDVGIAGIRAFNTVKCLHCHYAHHLARPEDNNVIGTWIAELLEKDGFDGGASLEWMAQRSSTEEADGERRMRGGRDECDIKSEGVSVTFTSSSESHIERPISLSTEEPPTCNTPPSEIETDTGTEVERAHRGEGSPYSFQWASMLGITKSTTYRTRIPGEAIGSTPKDSQHCALSDCICI